MTAHVTLGPQPPDPGGVEATIARHMPGTILGSVIVVGIAWWLAAQPPQQPPPWDPSRQAPPAWAGQAPPGDPHQQLGQQQRPSNSGGSGCSDCSLCVAVDCTDCMTGIDCADCVSCDCASGSCNVAGASSQLSMRAASPATARSCSTKRLGRLAESSGLLLPFFVLVAWRRRSRR